MRKWTLRQQVLWMVRERDQCSAPDICAALRQEREISLNAVQTVLNRLVDEGLLIRSGSRRHYLYAAQPTDEAARERASRAAVDLLSQSGESGLAHFLDAIDTLEPKAIEQLERLLAQRRARGSESDAPGRP